MNWDQYFLNICNVLAKNSKCFSRQIGAIVVVDKSIISTGYNGPPRGVPPCSERYKIDEILIDAIMQKNGYLDLEEIEVNSCPRRILEFKSGEGLEFCVAGHAERNALINAAREGIKVKGATMYMSCGIPCSPCLVEIINAGISEIVVTEMVSYDLMANYLINNSGLKVRVFDL